MVFQGGAFYLADGLSWNLGQAADAKRRALHPSADRDGEIGMTAEQRRQLQQDWLWAVPLNTVGSFRDTADELRGYAPG